jgi:cytochrome c peroxidase
MKKTTYSLLIVLFGLLAFSPADEQELPKTIAELGEKLFFDTILSRDYSISCGSCHIPEFAFADNKALSPGVEGKLGNRNTPSAMNMLSRSSFFWDGRAKTLEEQALGPIENPVEMDLPIPQAIERLNENSFYKKAFAKFFDEGITANTLAKAIATFERTLEGAATPFDKWMNGDENAISESAKRGHKIFLDKAMCFECHFGPDFTPDEFRNIGLYNGKNLNDEGRFTVTKDSSDLGKFKTPGLRNIALTAPYMHDGSFATLREVIEYYNDPDSFMHGSVNRDTLIRKLFLTKEEMDDLEDFLNSLTETKSIQRFLKK